MKQIIILIVVFMFLHTKMYSQNMACKPYFFIPNNFIDNGPEFGEKLKIRNLGITVNTKNLEYAPVVSLDGKKLYFVSDREGSKLMNNTEDSSNKSATFSKNLLTLYKDEKGDDVYSTSLNNFSYLFDFISQNFKPVYSEVIVFNDRNKLYMITNLSDTSLTNYGIDLSKLNKNESNLYEVENQEYDYLYDNYLSNLKKINKIIIEINEPSKNPLPLKNYFVLDSGRNIFPDENYKSVNIEYSHDIWFSKINYDYDLTLSQPINLDEDPDSYINTKFNEGTVSFSSDGRKVYFSKCNSGEIVDGCDIFVSEITNDKWGIPTNLGLMVNSKYWESQPSISADDKTLYFVSDRPVNPYISQSNNEAYKNGNLNIWYSKYQESSQSWSEAKPLNDINTLGREYCPFISADNKTLFFASDSIQPNYGKLDFYVTRFDAISNKWSSPINLGKPLNSEENDAFLTIPAGGDVIYFSSKRNDIPGFEGKLDLFLAHCDEEISNCLDMSRMSIYPNPFNEQTTLTVDIEKPDVIVISIYDVTGNLIKNVFNGSVSSGIQNFTWSGIDNLGNPLPTGAYYISVVMGENNNNYNERKCVVFSK